MIGLQNGAEKKFWSESKIVTVNTSMYIQFRDRVDLRKTASHTNPRADGRRTLLGCIFIDMRWKLTKKSEQLTW